MLRCIEEGADILDLKRLQTDDGPAAHSDYLGKARAWATAFATDQPIT